MRCAYDCANDPSQRACESCDPPAPLPMPAYNSDAYALWEIRCDQADREEYHS